MDDNPASRTDRLVWLHQHGAVWQDLDMKVAIFAYTDDAPTLETGVTTYNRELASRLCERFPEHRFSIYLAENNAKNFSDVVNKNLTKVIVPTRAKRADRVAGTSEGGRRVFSFAKLVVLELMHRFGLHTFPMRNALYDSVRELGEYDLVIYTVFGHLPDFPLYVKRKFGVRCASVIHDIRVLYAGAGDLKELLLRSRARYLLSRVISESDCTLVPSKFIKDILSRRYPSDAGRIHVSYIVPDMRTGDYTNASESPRVRELLESGRKYLFYPSTIVETKNHMNLVKAMALLRRDLPEVKLILAGSNADSPLAAELFRYVATNGLHENVAHLGFVSEADKCALYRGATALVIPSIGESFSLPIWEAFATGCAVIASTDRDIPEQVADAALLCDPNNPRDIADKIQRLWSDPDLRKRLVEMGRARYENVKRDSLFTGWESIIHK